MVDLREDAPRMIRQRHGRADAVGHGVDAAPVQIEPVEHHVRDMAACSVHVLGIAAKNGIALHLQTVGHGGQDAVFSSAVALQMLGHADFVRLRMSIVVIVVPPQECGIRNRVPARLPSTMS